VPLFFPKLFFHSPAGLFASFNLLGPAYDWVYQFQKTPLRTSHESLRTRAFLYLIPLAPLLAPKDMAELSQHPRFFSMSLEKRIAPRVLYMMSRGVDVPSTPLNKVLVAQPASPPMIVCRPAFSLRLLSPKASKRIGVGDLSEKIRANPLHPLRHREGGLIVGDSHCFPLDRLA